MSENAFLDLITHISDMFPDDDFPFPHLDPEDDPETLKLIEVEQKSEETIDEQEVPF